MKSPTKQEKVIVAMSGGVDSSVAALLLLRQGYQVAGATLDTGYGRAVQQAAAVCTQLGIEHHVVSARQQFAAEVVAEFTAAYLRGETPNPCVDCNARYKFPVLMHLLPELDVQYLATGHYVRRADQDGRVLLYCGDTAKDQSYFLYRLPQSILRSCLFPLGDYGKDEIRSIATAAGMASAAQKDSYDICFIEQGDYRQLLTGHDSAYLREGDIITADGAVVGRHQGLANYTLGQRRGLDIALGYPVYVVGMDAADNRLIVGEKSQLMAENAQTRDNTFLPFECLSAPLEVEVKVRYKAPPLPAIIRPTAADTGLLDIQFLQPVWGLAPGQSAVFYRQQQLIGGGKIMPLSQKQN